MLNWIPWTKNDFKVSHRTQVNALPNMKLVTSFMDFECQPCGIFEGLSYQQEYGVINHIILTSIVGLGHRINNLVS